MTEVWRSKKKPYGKAQTDGPNKPATQAELAARMSEAITRIEKFYSPDVLFEGAFEVEKSELDRLKLAGIEDVVEWEARWIALLRNVRRNL